MMKTKNMLSEICVIMFFLLFVYTSASKFLDNHNFVLQMLRAPVPGIKTLAPLLGVFMPSVELILAFGFAVGMFYTAIKIKTLIASVILLCLFETYIAIMLLSGSHLPCSCGGIISTLGWKDHLLLNGLLIIAGILTINFLKKHHSTAGNAVENKKLSRA